jgi:hypothetical protein
MNAIIPGMNLLFAINTAIYGAALLGLRWLCLSQLDWLMKRSDSG